jgi:hypothetical protein
MSNSPRICYLCGRPLAPPLSQDHVPPKQFYAKDVRKQHRLNLRTITVHQECNLSYQFDEDYFVNTFAPFAIGSYSGNAFLREFVQKFHSGKNRRLVSKVRKEFETRPSGLVLPPGLVAKRFEGERVHRVAWKIIRGLYFHHFNEFLPEDTPNGFQIVPPDQPPPKEFIIGLPDYPVRGQYPGVFDYKFAKFPELNNFNYWAMLLWDRIIMIMYFHDPSCDCDKCLEGKRDRDSSAITEQPLTGGVS